MRQVLLRGYSKANHMAFEAQPAAPSSNAAAKELKEKRKMKRLKELRKRFGAWGRMAFAGQNEGV